MPNIIRLRRSQNLSGQATIWLQKIAIVCIDFLACLFPPLYDWLSNRQGLRKYWLGAVSRYFSSMLIRRRGPHRLRRFSKNRGRRVQSRSIGANSWPDSEARLPCATSPARSPGPFQRVPSLKKSLPSVLAFPGNTKTPCRRSISCQKRWGPGAPFSTTTMTGGWTSTS